MSVNDALQWVLSLQSMVMLWLMGDGNRFGPVVGLFGQVVWISYAVKTGQWGLLPGIAGFTFVHARNCLKMRRVK